MNIAMVQVHLENKCSPIDNVRLSLLDPTESESKLLAVCENISVGTVPWIIASYITKYNIL